LLIRVFSTGPSIFVPNAFTPNGDGLNDKIRPITAGIERLDFFRIFNRYGQIIFETNNPEGAWDGTLKGKPQGSGTFIYQVQALDYTGEVLRQKGTFNLIR
jgi:gliding motility-associated-like protein